MSGFLEYYSIGRGSRSITACFNAFRVLAWGIRERGFCIENIPTNMYYVFVCLLCIY